MFLIIFEILVYVRFRNVEGLVVTNGFEVEGVGVASNLPDYLCCAVPIYIEL